MTGCPSFMMYIMKRQQPSAPWNSLKSLTSGYSVLVAELDGGFLALETDNSIS
jgi:hypothetical protein